jgi:hypothetical protein
MRRSPQPFSLPPTDRVERGRQIGSAFDFNDRDRRSLGDQDIDLSHGRAETEAQQPVALCHKPERAQNLGRSSGFASGAAASGSDLGQLTPRRAKARP